MIGEREKDFNSSEYGSLVMRQYDISGNNIDAFFDANDSLIFVLDKTINDAKPNVLLVINPDSGKKWDEILSSKYGVDLEYVRPKQDNKYQKLDIEYSGLSVYENLINAYNAGENIEENLNQLNVLRNSAVRHSAVLRLNAANETITKTNATIVKTKESIVRLETKLKTLRTKLSSMKKEIGRVALKQSAAKILRTESQIDATKEKLKRAQKRLESAQKRLEIATIDAKLANDLLNQPGAEIKQSVNDNGNSVAVYSESDKEIIKDEEPVKQITESQTEIPDKPEEKNTSYNGAFLPQPREKNEQKIKNQDSEEQSSNYNGTFLPQPPEPSEQKMKPQDTNESENEKLNESETDYSIEYSENDSLSEKPQNSDEQVTESEDSEKTYPEDTDYSEDDSDDDDDDLFLSESEDSDDADVTESQNSDESEQETSETNESDVKPLLDKDPDIIDEDIAFKPITFETPDVPMNEPVVNTAPSAMLKVPDSNKVDVEESDGVRDDESEQPKPMLDSLTSVSDESVTSETIVDEPLNTDSDVNEIDEHTEIKEEEPFVISDYEDNSDDSNNEAKDTDNNNTHVPMDEGVRPASPIVVGAVPHVSDSDEQKTKSKSSFVYFLLLLVLIGLSIFALWLYQKNMGDGKPFFSFGKSAPVVTPMPEQPKPEPIVVEPQPQPVASPVVVVVEKPEQPKPEPMQQKQPIEDTEPFIIGAVSDKISSFSNVPDNESETGDLKDGFVNKPAYKTGEKYDEMFVYEEEIPVDDADEYDEDYMEPVIDSPELDQPVYYTDAEPVVTYVEQIQPVTAEQYVSEKTFIREENRPNAVYQDDVDEDFYSYYDYDPEEAAYQAGDDGYDEYR